MAQEKIYERLERKATAKRLRHLKGGRKAWQKVQKRAGRGDTRNMDLSGKRAKGQLVSLLSEKAECLGKKNVKRISGGRLSLHRNASHK